MGTEDPFSEPDNVQTLAGFFSALHPQGREHEVLGGKVSGSLVSR